MQAEEPTEKMGEECERRDHGQGWWNGEAEDRESFKKKEGPMMFRASERPSKIHCEVSKYQLFGSQEVTSGLVLCSSGQG